MVPTMYAVLDRLTEEHIASRDAEAAAKIVRLLAGAQGPDIEVLEDRGFSTVGVASYTGRV
jgi:hypothetical protein